MLFGELRRLAVRNPRLALALGQSPSLTLDVGWLFTADHTVASVSLNRVRVGQTAFPVSGAETTPWLPPILASVAGRFGEVRTSTADPAQRLLAAMLSPDPQTRARYVRAVSALQAPPFDLPALQLVRGPDGPASSFGATLTRARQLGPAAERALGWVLAVHLDAPDVLIVPDDPPPAIRAWLAAATQGDDATLEQVIVLGHEA